MLVPHHLNLPISGKGYIPPISSLVTISNYKKHPLFRAFSGNLPETTAKIYPPPPFPRKCPSCIRVGLVRVNALFKKTSWSLAWSYFTNIVHIRHLFETLRLGRGTWFQLWLSGSTYYSHASNFKPITIHFRGTWQITFLTRLCLLYWIALRVKSRHLGTFNSGGFKFECLLTVQHQVHLHPGIIYISASYPDPDTFPPGQFPTM